jgi:hypothetical protein
MAKRLAVKVGEFTNQQGETKGEYVRLGALMAGNDGGEYLLLDPTVNLAGALTKQNMMNHKNGKQVRDSLMVSVFDDSNGKQQGGQQQASNNLMTKTYHLISTYAARLFNQNPINNQPLKWG